MEIAEGRRPFGTFLYCFALILTQSRKKNCKCHIYLDRGNAEAKNGTFSKTTHNSLNLSKTLITFRTQIDIDNIYPMGLPNVNFH